MSVNAKDFLYAWLGKQKKVNPVYNVQQNMRGGTARFVCTLQVSGYSFQGMGNSTNKKDAQTNAAQDFINFLVRSGEVHQGEAPKLGIESLEATSSVGESQRSLGFGFERNNSQFDSCEIDFRPPKEEEPYEACQSTHQLTNRDLYVTQRAEEVAQSESVDLKAEIHGGWTVENSKQALNEFMQKIKQPPAAFHTVAKADLSRDFCATLNCYIPHVNRHLRAEGNASTKKMAEATCAMSMVRQLFHLNLMAAYGGKRVKNSDKNNLPPVAVSIPDELTNRITAYLSSMGIKPTEVNYEECQFTPQSLIVDHILAHFPDSEVSPPCNVSWSPPQQNWNPWRACNIDEPPLSFMSLGELSQKISEKESMKIIPENISRIRKELPVSQFRDRIIHTIKNNQVTLIKGETGCGKSTQVAQYLLESFIAERRGAEFNVFVSQPRRISAISLAERVATERCENIGESVGYGVRFDTVSPRPYGSIFFCTVGVLLRKMESGLRGVSHVIIDEIHERDIDTDFVLIVLREMIREFRDLRIILMSATINTAMFTEYFGNCPVIEMHGRTHLVERFFLEDILHLLKYIPIESKNTEEDEKIEDDQSRNLNLLPSDAPEPLREAMKRINENDIPNDVIERILIYIHEKGQEGAVLIFLPGWAEIMTLLTQLTEHPLFGKSGKFVILPLHSQLTGIEQRRVFQHFAGGVRKIILSTNIAETSVTIDDVVFVIDSCKSRERLYSTTNNMIHYATVWASRSNIKQRSGRAGRVRPGYAFILCSKARHEVLEEHKTAEILRTPLTSVALTIKLLRLGSVGDFLARAIESPPVDMVIEAESVLHTMGALDRNLELTALGRILAKMPIEPGMGKTIVMAASFGIASLLCEIAAASSFSTPFVPKERNHTRLTQAQRSFAGSRWSDHICLLSVNQQFNEASQQGGSDAELNFCQRYSLNCSSFKMTRGASNQLLETLVAAGFPGNVLAPHYAEVNGVDSNLDLLTSLLIQAYYPNVGFHKGKRQLYTLEQARALTSKTSVLTPFKGDQINLPSPFLIFTEKVRSRTVQCKEISVLNALQLLLFGSRKIFCLGKNLIRLDDMINIQIDAATAAKIVALRPCIEGHLVRTCMNPEGLGIMSEADVELGNLLKELSSPRFYANAEMKDAILSDAALHVMKQPINHSPNHRGSGYRGRGRFTHGVGSHNQWGFGESYNSYMSTTPGYGVGRQYDNFGSWSQSSGGGSWPRGGRGHSRGIVNRGHPYYGRGRGGWS